MDFPARDDLPIADPPTQAEVVALLVRFVAASSEVATRMRELGTEVLQTDPESAGFARERAIQRAVEARHAWRQVCHDLDAMSERFPVTWPHVGP